MFGEIKLLFKGFAAVSENTHSIANPIMEFEYWISDGVHWLKFESPEGQAVAKHISEQNG